MPGQKYSFLNKANPREKRGRGAEGRGKLGSSGGWLEIGEAFFLMQKEENNTFYFCI